MKNKQAIFLFCYSHGMGMTFHLAQLAEALAQELNTTKRRNDADLFICSTNNEQNSGLLKKTLDTLGKEFCIYDDEELLSVRIEAVISKFNYEKVLVCVQGPRQVKLIKHLKKKFGSRVKIYVRVNSFRNGTRLARAISLMQLLLYNAYCDYVNFQTFKTYMDWHWMKLIKLRFVPVIIPLGMEESAGVTVDVSHLGLHIEDDGVFKLIYLANFTKNKRHEELIMALAPMLEIRKNFRLYLFGEGPQLSYINNLIKSLGLQEKVVLPGRVERRYIPSILKQMSCAVVVSGSETFGHCVLEPLSCGIPVISTTVGVSVSVISDYHNGFLVKDSIKDELPYYVDSLLRDKSLLDSLRCSSANSVSMFSWNRVACAYLTLLNAID